MALEVESSWNHIARVRISSYHARKSHLPDISGYIEAVNRVHSWTADILLIPFS